MKFIVNPENYTQNYLKYLNECFSNWGNIEAFDWVINREFDNMNPDFFIIQSDQDAVLAGSAISYRNIKFPDNSIQKIGIMTGSWTLPISRGLGCFTASIKKSSELAAIKNASFLTAFVTESNASFRRLKEAGSILIPTNYVISESLNNFNATEINEIEILQNNTENINLLFENRKSLLKNKVHFCYSFDDFTKQFIKRSNPVFLLKIQNDYAIIEETSKMFQLHFSTNYSLKNISKIVNWAHYQEKEIIFFSTNLDIEIKQSQNFKILDGFFTILPSKNASPFIADFLNKLKINIDFGDKM